MKKREVNLMRRVLVGYVTIQSFALLLFFVIAPYLFGRIRANESWSVIQLLLPVLAGYLGQIVGFYFARQEKA